MEYKYDLDMELLIQVLEQKNGVLNAHPDYLLELDGNGDGYDDLAICAYLLFDSPAPDYSYYRFYYGGPDAEIEFTDYDYEYGYLVGPGYYSDREWFTSCLGDVNGDGCDDMGFILQRESSTRGLGVMLGGTFEMIIVENNIDTSYPLNIEPVGDLNDETDKDIAFIQPIYSTVDEKEDLGIYDQNLILSGDEFPIKSDTQVFHVRHR